MGNQFSRKKREREKGKKKWRKKTIKREKGRKKTIWGIDAGLFAIVIGNSTLITEDSDSVAKH